MPALRRLVPALLAVVLALGAPFEMWAAPTDSASCAMATVEAGDAGCCSDETSATGCSAICLAGCAAMVAENAQAAAISASIVPGTLRPSLLATQARAPDTAPPKPSIT